MDKMTNNELVNLSLNLKRLPYINLNKENQEVLNSIITELLEYRQMVSFVADLKVLAQDFGDKGEQETMRQAMFLYGKEESYKEIAYMLEEKFLGGKK